MPKKFINVMTTDQGSISINPDFIVAVDLGHERHCYGADGEVVYVEERPTIVYVQFGREVRAFESALTGEATTSYTEEVWASMETAQ